jgi:multidrug efflux pump subunit AcrA (membrane-fusion protein)
LRANETTERERAEALFKKEEQMREGEKAMAEYKAAQQAIREKTARLRALRLARDAAKQEQALRRSAQPLQRSPHAGSLPLTSARGNPAP